MTASDPVLVELPRLCTVEDCDEPASPRHDECSMHLKRLRNFGTTCKISELVPPIPQSNSPGVSRERVEELKAMSWDELVALCNSILEQELT